MFWVWSVAIFQRSMRRCDAIKVDPEAIALLELPCPYPVVIHAGVLVREA